MLEAVRNLFRRRARTLLTVFGIAIGVLALTVMGSMAQKVDRMVGGVQQYLQYRIAIGEHGQSPFYGGGLIPSHLAREAARVPGVAVVETTLTLLYHSNQGPTLSLPDTIVGVHLSQLLKAEPLEPPDIRLTFARGGWWKAGAEWAGVIGSSLAREVHARVGHYIRVHGHRFLVTGLLNPTLTSPDTMMFVPMGTHALYPSGRRRRDLPLPPAVDSHAFYHTPYDRRDTDGTRTPPPADGQSVGTYRGACSRSPGDAHQ